MLEKSLNLELESFEVSNFNWLGDGKVSKNDSIKNVLIKVRARHIPVEGQVDILKA